MVEDEDIFLNKNSWQTGLPVNQKVTQLKKIITLADLTEITSKYHLSSLNFGQFVFKKLYVENFIFL